MMRRLKQLQSSRLVPSQDGHDTTGQVDPSVHGQGPIEVSLPNFPTEIDDRVNASTSSPGSVFPFDLDMNSGDTIGIGAMLLEAVQMFFFLLSACRIGYTQSTIGGGERSSSATAYLDPLLSRPNLDVLIQHQATKIIANGTSGGKIRFSGVEFAANATGESNLTIPIHSFPREIYPGPRKTVEATKEVILSAGAIGSPQLLLLSGIGNKTTLEEFGIESVIDLPDVGQHLQDHPIMSNYFTVNSTTTLDAISRNATVQAEDLEQWNNTRTGQYSATRSNTLGFLRLSSNDSVFENFTDPSAGRFPPSYGPGQQHTDTFKQVLYLDIMNSCLL